MKRHHLFLTGLALLLGVTYAHAENSSTTVGIYPSPAGAYYTLQLIPSSVNCAEIDSKTNAKVNSGTIFIDPNDPNGELQVCKPDGTASSAGLWSLQAGFNAADSSKSYLAPTIDSHPLYTSQHMGLGTGVYHIKDVSTETMLNIKGQLNQDGITIEAADPSKFSSPSAMIGFRNDGKDSIKFTLGLKDDSFMIGTSALDVNTRLTIDSNGFMGVGTPTPETRFQVVGGAMRVGSTTTAGVPSIEFSTSGASTGMGVVTHSIFGPYDASSGDVGALYIGAGRKSKDNSRNDIVLYNLSCSGGTCNVPNITLDADLTTMGGKASVQTPADTDPDTYVATVGYVKSKAGACFNRFCGCDSTNQSSCSCAASACPAPFKALPGVSDSFMVDHNGSGSSWVNSTVCCK